MRVGLDLDGVVYPWSLAARDALKEFRGVPDIGESTHWDYIKECISAEDWKWMWTEGIGKVFGQNLSFYPGAPTFMRQLGREHELAIITHRPKVSAPQTTAWLAHHRVQFNDLHIMLSQQYKSTVTPQCDVYVDDKPEVVDDLLLHTSAHVFTPRRLWNEGYLTPVHDGYERFHWYEDLKEVTAWLTQQ